MNKKEIEIYKKKLVEMKKKISAQLSEVYNESKTIETGIAQDVGDKAESSYTKEFLLSLSDTERELLILIDNALKRIDECTYSVCQRCEKAIGKKRLDVVPWTAYCISCQELEEEEYS